MDNVSRSEGEPRDRITKIANRALEAIEDEDMQAIVMVFEHKDGHTSGGVAMGGYDNDTDAIADVLVHLQAIFQANGKELIVAPVSQG